MAARRRRNPLLELVTPARRRRAPSRLTDKNAIPPEDEAPEPALPMDGADGAADGSSGEPEHYPETVEVEPGTAETVSPSSVGSGLEEVDDDDPVPASGSALRGPQRPRPRIPGYRIEEAIGRGATGIVYRATQLAVERPVALKILHPELVGTKRAVRRLQREARTAARLAHPSIISAIDMGEEDGQWWYAMELVEGQPLSERLRKGPVSEREALRIFTPLCEALQHACEAGVVHRDIKPANILIDERGRARLVDLGLAFAEDDPMMTKVGGTLGTPHYISPEQARDPATADSRSDIWSLGATLFHSVCGQPPFGGDSVAEILSGVLYERIPDPRRLNPHLSRGMVLVLRKCLNHDPARRYQQPAELLRDLERLRERRSPRVRAGSLDPVQGQRSLIVLAGAVVGVGLLVVGGVWVVVSRPWQDVGPTPVSLGGPRSFPRIEGVIRGFEEREDLAKPTLEQLAVLKDQLAPHDDVARQKIESGEQLVIESLGDSLDRLKEFIDDNWEDLLAERNFPALDRLFDEELERVLYSLTGFDGVDDLPIQLAGRIHAWRNPWLRRVNFVREEALRDARDCMEQYTSTPGTGLDRELAVLTEAGRWREAQELFEGREAAGWIQAAGCDATGLDHQQVLATAQASIDEHLRQLQLDWRALDRELYSEINSAVEEMTRRLERGQVTRASEVLREEFEIRFADVPLLREQTPLVTPEWPSTALRALDAQELQLEARERELVANLAETRLRELVEQAEGEPSRNTVGLCGRRQYAQCEKMWVDEIAYWRNGMQSDALDGVIERMAQGRREAQLLQELLSRAAKGVERSVQRREEIELQRQSLRVRGRLELNAASNPLQTGFRLVDSVNQVTHQFSLVPTGGGATTVSTDNMIRLSNLNGVVLSDDEQLMKALFYYHDAARYDDARRVLPVAINDPLVADLRDRIRNRSQRVTEANRQVRERLESGLISLRRHASESEPDYDRLLEDLRGLRTTFSEDLTEEELSELQEYENRFRDGKVELRQVDFSSHEREDLPLSQSRLTWLFDRRDLTGWVPGRWRSNLFFYEQPDALSQKELIDEANALSHPLAAPLDMTRDISVTWVLERDEESPPVNTAILGVPGFWIYYETGTEGRFWIDTRPLDEGLMEFDDGKGWAAPIWPEKGEFELKLEFDPADGRCRVFLDGEALEARKREFSVKSEGASRPGQMSIVAAQPLIVHQCHLEGRFD